MLSSVKGNLIDFKGILLAFLFQRKQIFLFWMFIDLLGFVTTKHRSHIVKNLTLKFPAHHYHNLKVSPCILAQDKESGGGRQGDRERQGGREGEKKRLLQRGIYEQMLESNSVLREKEINSYMSTSRLLFVVFCM